VLARLGFADPASAERHLSDPALGGLVDPLDERFSDGLADGLGLVADPDLALLSLVRLMESLRGRVDVGDRETGDDEALSGLVGTLRRAGPGRERLLSVLGASSALGDHLVAHPEHWRSVADAAPREPGELREHLVRAVREPGELSPEDALRVAYRRELLGIAALDLTSEQPTATYARTASALADLADAALEAATQIARDEAGEAAERCRIAVIAMGKTGGRELNYVSDVDVIFVAEPAPGAEEGPAMATATRIATRLMRVCSASTAHGTLWPVDAALRPEGKQGPLVRTVPSHVTYYERWAKTWEFQALLKARPAAGDAELGQAYVEAVLPFVWEAASRENFVEDVQAMRRRVEDHVPSGDADRQLKLGPGGLRDVEFSVQLLQLVHGRADASLRSRTTLEALDALSAGGYVGRDDATVLDAAYRFLRTLEHRIQLFRLRRTHLLPRGDADLRRLGRALGHRTDPAAELVEDWKRQAREVRRLHERLFYRPLLSATARLRPSEVRLTPEAARERLAALGFRDPGGALRHIQALTDGVSRRASIQRQLLPIMLGWFADEADPDAGLLTFRKVSEELGSTHWYLRQLRDEGSAAERMAHVLGRSRFSGDLLLSAPEAVRYLGEPGGLVPLERSDLLGRMRAASGRKDDPDAAVAAARGTRRGELFRIASADLLGELDLDAVGSALTDVSAATIQVGLDVAERAVADRRGEELLTRLLVVGMGRLGGGEPGYSSDADVLFVHEPLPGGEELLAQEQATDVVQELRRLLSRPGVDPQIGLDADLRPEGKSGPLVRSLDSYAEYYRRWSMTWESQALLRACPIAGDEGLASRFVELVDPLRWPEDGLTAEEVTAIRTLKARMESERLPRGADPRTHFKLGQGGLSDVEWTIQLLQMEHAHEVPGLRTTSTTVALTAAVDGGVLDPADARVLRESWCLASALRNAGMLFRGRPVDAVPSDHQDADGVARIIGMPPGSGGELAERYRRVARRARFVVERLFYGWS
jgi:glutamate-ammonia-ligase adenylyltransferase